MHQQPVNLLLKLAVDFVEHFKANEVIADHKLVAVFEKGFVDWLAVQQSSISLIKINQSITLFTRSLVAFGADARVQT